MRPGISCRRCGRANGGSSPGATARLTLLLPGKRFGFSLGEMRQILDLYDTGDQQRSQIARACEVARVRLAAMEAQRDALGAAIADLRDQMRWGARMLASLEDTSDAAE